MKMVQGCWFCCILLKGIGSGRSTCPEVDNDAKEQSLNELEGYSDKQLRQRIGCRRKEAVVSLFVQDPAWRKSSLMNTFVSEDNDLFCNSLNTQMHRCTKQAL